MKRLLVVVAILGLGALMPTGAYAQTTANLAISASVNARCTIAVTTQVVFGAYDPLVTNATAPLDNTGGALSVTCTRGSIPTISLGLGTHASGAVRRMSDGATPTPNFLTYELYQPSGFTAVWGTGGAAYTATVTTSLAPRAFTVNGRVAGGQDVPVGSYTDTVVATVNF